MTHLLKRFFCFVLGHDWELTFSTSDHHIEHMRCRMCGKQRVRVEGKFV